MKSFIIAGLLAVSAVAALAAPAKTSKPVALSDSQMKAIKGQGTMIVYQWNPSLTDYVLVYVGYIGPTPGYIYQVRFSGGPQDGVLYLGVPQETPGSPNQIGSGYGPINNDGSFNDYHPFLHPN